MPRTIAYLRVSTGEQAQSGLGIDAQLAAIKTKVGEPDIVIKDAGISGDTLDRPGLAELLDILERGDTVVVAKLDRLSRGDVFAAAWLEKEIVEKRKASIISAAGEGTGDDTPQGMLMRDIIKAFAKFELAMIRQRTSAAVKVKMERKRQAGEKTGGKHAPYGFDVVMVDGVKKLTVNQQERDIISIMVAMRNAGESLQSIADKLTADGVTTRGGGKWIHTSVRKILARENSTEQQAA